MTIDIDSLDRLQLEPGDYVIAKTSIRYSQEQYHRILHQLESTFKRDIEEKGVKILLLDEGLELIKLNVIKKEC